MGHGPFRSVARVSLELLQRFPIPQILLAALLYAAGHDEVVATLGGVLGDTELTNGTIDTPGEL